MKNESTIILSRSDVASLLTLDECIDAVEEAFKLYAEGKVSPPGILGIHAHDGGFHIKAGIDKNYFVAKTNANFPQNKKRNGLPTIQGVINVFDAENGRLLALMDSIELTIIRTGAATAVAAKYLAMGGAKIATICGCGEQGTISLKMLLKVRQLETIYAYDLDKSLAEKFAQELSEEFKISVVAVDDLGKAVRQSEICITCTPSKQHFLKREYVAPGTFIAAIGSDSEEKQEMEPAMLASCKLVVDLVEQCATIGELHHALDEGFVTRADVHAELGEIIAGKKTGRTSSEEVIIFDSTGMALQDVAAASIVYEKAVKDDKGTKVNFNR